MADAAAPPPEEAAPAAAEAPGAADETNNASEAQATSEAVEPAKEPVSEAAETAAASKPTTPAKLIPTKSASKPAHEDRHIPASSPVGNLDAANEDLTKLRRMFAEKPEWNLATVNMLQDLCVEHITKNFEYNSAILDQMCLKQRQAVLANLPTNLPLKLTARLITEQGYWKRCCKAAWRVADSRDYGGDWRRMFFERSLQTMIENFIPRKTDPTALNDLVSICSEFIQRLDITQLLPPVQEPAEVEKEKELEEDDCSDAGSEPDEDNQIDHFDFRPLLEKLPHIEELRVTYSVKDCGMNFEWGHFQFTQKDTIAISEAVQNCKSLKVFSLHRSRVDDEKIRVVISHMLDHPGLRHLDLSHNLIGDRGARAVGKLLNGHSKLEHVSLQNNQINIKGGQAIAHALTKNDTVTFLDLRLNKLGDEGGQAIAKSLLQNSTLRELNVATNQLTEPTAAILALALASNSTLVKLNISCNKLGQESGKQLKEALDGNKVLQWLDLRLTDVGAEAEYCIEQILLRNRGQLKSGGKKLSVSRPVSSRGSSNVTSRAQTGNSVRLGAADTTATEHTPPTQQTEVAQPVEATA